LIMSYLHHAKYSLLLHSLDPAHKEPGLEVQAEQAQARDSANLSLDQGKPRCI
jgi:hypothetical protein